MSDGTRPAPATIEYAPIEPRLHRFYATLHRVTLTAGQPVRVPALLGQVWLSRVPIWWVPPRATTPHPLPAAAVVGPTTASFDLLAETDAAFWGCGLWPLGWAELIGLDAGAAADSVVEATRRWPTLVKDWEDGSADDDAATWAALTRFARALASTRRPSPDARRIAAVDTWLDTSEGPQELSARLGVSPRQAARITTRTHGGPPSLIAAKWRALRAAAELGLAGANEGAVWSRYADQPHFIREFRRFIGYTPGVFASDEANLSRRVVADEWHLASDHALALAHQDTAQSNTAQKDTAARP